MLATAVLKRPLCFVMFSSQALIDVNLHMNRPYFWCEKWPITGLQAQHRLVALRQQRLNNTSGTYSRSRWNINE